MFFPVTIKDAKGNVKKVIPSEKLSEQYWSNTHAVMNMSFSESAHQNIRYAERKEISIGDYNPRTDIINPDDSLESPNNEGRLYQRMLNRT